MILDVCPATRLRCPFPIRCVAQSCAAHTGLRPVAERELTPIERYHMLIAEQSAGKARD